MKKNSSDVSEEYGKLYSFGNVAYDVKTNPLITEDDKTKTAPRKIKKVKRDTYPLTLTMLIFFVFITISLNVLSTSFVQNQQQINKAIKNEYNELVSINNITRAEMSKQINLSHIEETAINKLGMVRPQKYQYVHIDVPKESYTVVETAAVPQTNFFLTFLNFFDFF